MLRRNVPLLALLAILAAGSAPAATHPLIGAYPGDWPTAANLARYETLQGRHLDIGLIYVDFATDFSVFRANAEACRRNGTLLLISWMPNGFTCAQIADGAKDDYVHRMARDLKGWGSPVRIRPIYECNGDWFSWAMGKPENKPADYVRAFRHLVDVFRAEHVTNVQWEYNVNYESSAGATLMDGYPGDDYVDLLGIDGYNWGTTQSWSSWRSFRATFDHAYRTLAARHKPISLSEWGCTEFGGDKAAWITDAFRQITASGDYDLIESAVWFHINKETDWRIDSSEASLAAYRSAIGSSSTPAAPSAPRPSPEKP